MPFMARCRRCNYYLFERTRFILEASMEYHDLKSHNDESGDWVIVVMRWDEYHRIRELKGNSVFWDTLRNAVKRAKERISSSS